MSGELAPGLRAPSSAEDAPSRRDFVHFYQLATRWMDIDVYGHVNNVVYYSYFDTAVNDYLVRYAGLDPSAAPVVGLVVETRCTFKKSLTFPETIDVGVKAVRIGTSSVAYAIGIFKQGDHTAAAFGDFVHVYVARATGRPVPIPELHREALERIRGSR